MLIYVVEKNVYGESCDYLMKGIKEWAFLDLDHALNQIWDLINDYNKWAKNHKLDSTSFDTVYRYYPQSMQDDVKTYHKASYPTIVTFGKIQGNPYQNYIVQHCDITIKAIEVTDTNTDQKKG